MPSNGVNRGGLLDAGGVLSVIGGVVELVAGGIVLSIVRQIMVGGRLPTVPHIPWVPGLEIQLVFFPARFMIVGVFIVVLGGIGIAGGISALSRKSFGRSLVGAICILPTVLLGIMAIVFVALSTREFDVEVKESWTSRSRLLTAGGILSIIGGGIELIGPWVSVEPIVSFWNAPWLPAGVPAVIFLFSFISIMGGILALERKGYWVSLFGAICALPTVIFGTLAVIFVAMRKSEFEEVWGEL